MMVDLTPEEILSSRKILEASLRDFRRSVEITRDVRFQANLRLGRRQRGSSYIVSLLSLYVIALSLIPNILHLELFQNQLLLACSIVLSVFVIFTSLIDGAQNFFHQRELLHQCARKAASVNHDLKNIDPHGNLEEAWKSFHELKNAYPAALNECTTKHDNIDFTNKNPASRAYLKKFGCKLTFFHIVCRIDQWQYFSRGPG